MKYLVTWKVDKQIPIPCPDIKPDPYTGETTGMSCLVYHCQVVTETKSAEFETEKEAQEFIEKAPTNCRYMIYVLLEKDLSVK